MEADHRRGPIFQDYQVMRFIAGPRHCMARNTYSEQVRRRLLFTHHDREFSNFGHQMEDSLPVIQAGDVLRFPNWRDSLWGKTQPCLMMAR